MTTSRPFQRFFSGDLPTIMIAALGGVFLWWLGIPAAWLSGAMVATALMLVFGRRPTLAPSIASFAMLMTGMGMGASVTPEMIAGIARYPFSLIGFGAALALGTAAQYLWLVHSQNWSRGTAIFSAAPGAMSSIMATAAEINVDVSRVAMVQCVRLFILMALLPSLVAGSGAVDMHPPVLLVAAPVDILIILSASIACAYLFIRIGMTAPVLFGGMVASSLLHVSGIVHGGMPIALTNFGYLLIGAFVGVRFNTIDKRQFRALLFTSVGAFLIGIVVTAAGAFAMSQWLAMPFGKTMVAYSPGGLEAMIALSSALALDPLFAGAHHVVRFIGITLLLPFFIKLARKDNDVAQEAPET